MVNAVRNPHQAKHYKALSGLAWDAFSQVAGYLAKLSDKQLNQAEQVLMNLSTSNCGWPVYEMRELMKSAVHNVRIERAREKASKSAAA